MTQSKIKSPIWWISVDGFTSSTSIQAGEERRQPSISGTFKVKFIEGVCTGYENMEGNWTKIIWVEDRCGIVLTANEAQQIRQLEELWLQEAIQEAIEIYLDDTQRVVRTSINQEVTVGLHRRS